MKFLKPFAVAGILFSVLIQPAYSGTVVVFGASGKIGGLIVEEALRQGHEVIGVSRSPDKLQFEDAKFSAVAGDVSDPASIKSVSKGADAILISVTGAGEGNAPENSLENRAALAMIEAFSGDDKAPRVLQIGGATTIFETKEAMMENIPFPDAKEPGSFMHGMLFGHLEALNNYRNSDIKWTVVTPAMHIQGWSPQGLDRSKDKRTGEYRTSTSGMIMDENGEPSPISVSDLAHAIVSEVNNAEFIQQRFTLGY